MISVERAIRIEAPADVAWEVLGDFTLSKLIEGILTHVTLEGSGVGTVRTMHLVAKFGGGYVKERLEEYDAVDRFMRYRMVDSGPIPFADYLGSIRVTPAGPAACVALMTASFVPVDIDEGTARGISVGNITQALENARKAVLESSQAAPRTRTN